MGLFNMLADVVSAPFDVVSDVSSAIQGKKPTRTKEKIEELGKDTADTIRAVKDLIDN
jgi:hypothetical protein